MIVTENASLEPNEGEAARYVKNGNVQLAEELNTTTTLLRSTKAALGLHGGCSKGDAELAAAEGATRNRSKKAAGANK